MRKVKNGSLSREISTWPRHFLSLNCLAHVETSLENEPLETYPAKKNILHFQNRPYININNKEKCLFKGDATNHIEKVRGTKKDFKGFGAHRFEVHFKLYCTDLTVHSLYCPVQ